MPLLHTTEATSVCTEILYMTTCGIVWLPLDGAARKRSGLFTGKRGDYTEGESEGVGGCSEGDGGRHGEGERVRSGGGGE